ncbi:MAG: hypothetical protein ACREQQ_11980, partial [Candidatus Binatia bacterium]
MSGGGDGSGSGGATPGESINDLRARIAELERSLEEYRKLYLLAREEIAQLKRGLIGRRAERPPVDDPQLSLAVLDLLLGHETAPAATPTEIVAEHTRKKPVRKPFPEELPRVRVEIVPPEVESAGRDAFEVIGVESREVLERRPASLVVVEVVKPKFVRKESRAALATEVLIAETPE